MKKVFVVTVYNSLNSGSFLQATALYRSIEKMGYETYFLKTGARNLFKQASIEFIYMIKQGNIRPAFQKYKQAIELSNLLKGFRTKKLSDDIIENKECFFVLGSDEIWNLSRKDMARYPIFWGAGLPLERTFSYAPSLNNATLVDVASYEPAKKAIERLSAISVRDNYSFDTISNITDRDVYEVCDPTLLLSVEDYTKFISKRPVNNYILVYIYKKAVSEADINEIIRYSRENNKKLVAFGSNFDWCDINANGSPYDFLSYIYYADYVFTSTFHGTLFSSLFQKQFVVVGNKNRKVSELVTKLGLSRMASSNELASIISEDYDKDDLEKKIMAMRSESINYISTAVSKIEKESRSEQ